MVGSQNQRKESIDMKNGFTVWKISLVISGFHTYVLESDIYLSLSDLLYSV